MVQGQRDERDEVWLDGNAPSRGSITAVFKLRQ